MFFAVYAVKGTCRIVRQSKLTPRKVMLFFLKLNNRNCGKMLTVTSVLLLAFAVASPVLRAQDWDDINGQKRSNQGQSTMRPSRSRARKVNRLPITWISTLTFAPQSAIRSVAGMLPSPEKQRTPYPMSRPSTGLVRLCFW